MSDSECNVVEHPRYGIHPRPSGCDEAVALERKDWGEYFASHVFPETAILADPTKQNYTVFPREYYVDKKKTCRGCGRKFIFFAEEKKHWFEELRFSIDAKCVDCPECRKSNQERRTRLTRFSSLVSKPDIDDASLADLVADASYMWEQGLLKKEDKLRRIRNLANARIPDHANTKLMNALFPEENGRSSA